MTSRHVVVASKKIFNIPFGLAIGFAVMSLRVVHGGPQGKGHN
jgi:hypothetical protein